MLRVSVLYCNALRNYSYHRTSPVLTATVLVNEVGQILTPYRISTPQLIAKKFVMNNYVGDRYTHAKFGAKPSMGVSVKMDEILYNENYVYLFLPFLLAPLEARLLDQF